MSEFIIHKLRQEYFLVFRGNVKNILLNIKIVGVSLCTLIFIGIKISKIQYVNDIINISLQQSSRRNKHVKEITVSYLSP